MKKTAIIVSLCCASLAVFAGALPGITEPVPVQAVVYDGQTQNKSADYTWKFDDETGVIEFTGTGTLTADGWQKYKNSVKTAVVGEGITDISYGVFTDNPVLESVTLPSTVTSIGVHCFKNCPKLKSVNIPEGVKQIHTGAFYDCVSLESIVIPDSVKAIDVYAFSGCAGLKSVTFGKNITKIDMSAFYNCSSLTSVTLPEKLQELKDGAFSNCTKLADIVMPANVGSVAAGVFEGTAFEANSDNYTNGVLYCGNVIIGADNTKLPEKLTIKSGTKIIANGAFVGCTKLKEVVLPSSLLNIGTLAFKNCSNLEKVTFNSKLKTIGAYAFENCKKLQSAVLPDSVTDVGAGAFQYCKGLTEVKLPETLTEIHYYTFRGCKGIKYMKLPDALTAIGDEAFQDVYGEIEIPDSVYVADAGINRGKPVLDSEDVRENYICYAGKHAQTTESDEKISETVKFRDGTVSISAHCLSGSSKIKAVIVPESVVYIGWNSLTCKNLKKAAIYNPDCFFYDTGYNNIFPNTVVIYGYKGSTAEAFAEKYGLKFCLIDCFDGHAGVTTKAGFNADGKQEKVCSVCGTANSSTTIPKVSSVTLSKDSYICHDSEYRPTVTVKDSKGNRLIENTDFTVTYKNNVNIGKASAVVKLIGNKYSGTKTLYYTINPALVYGLKTESRTDTSVTLSWNKVDGAITYRIYKYSAADNKYTQIGSTKNTSYTVKNLKPDTNYTYYLTASKTVNNVRYESAGYSKISTYTTIAAVKGAAATQTTSSVKLTWSKVTGATRYKIYKYNSTTKKYEQVGTTKNTYYTIKDLKSGTVYIYYVKAYKSENGKTLLSPTYTKIKTATKTKVPASLTLTAGAKKFTAKWGKAAGATGYEIAYATSKNGTYKKVSTTNLSRTVTGLISGKTYYVKVRTYKTVGSGKVYSLYSDTKTVKVK